MFRFPKRVALVAALAAIGVLSVASSAGATVAPPEVIEHSVFVTGNDDPDAIALTVSGGFIAVNGTPTTLKADAQAEVSVDGGGGNDTVDATALGTAYKTLVIEGGTGDDLLTGGANADIIGGNAGDDRVVGFKGDDELFGGEGADVLVWNNGDNTDRDSGDAGVDEVEINGAPTANDSFVARPNPTQAGWVEFERLNLGKFKVNLQAERLTVNGLGGEDGFAPDPAAPTGLAGLTAINLNGGSANDVLDGGDGADVINGGAGNDSLFGLAGNDQVNGGEGNDVLEGEEGEDRLTGGTGTDEMFGDQGDDVLVWNNGDGTDPVNEGGADFDRVEVNGSPAAGDEFLLEADGTGGVFQRLNLVPFTLGISPSVEAVSVNGAAGNDVLTVVQDGARMLVAADGGSGNDELTGGAEADSFLGGSGDDSLVGGRGSDLLDGGVGDDGIAARDVAGDLVRGGAGYDAAVTDETTVDAIDGVEQLDATPAPVPAQPQQPAGGTTDTRAIAPTVGKVALVRPGGKLTARVSLTCPVAEANGCHAALTLVTAKPVYFGALRAALVLGSRSVDLAPGQTMTVPVRLNGAAARVASHGRLATRIRVDSSDAAGNSTTRSALVALRIPGN